jgi:transcription-repair coupling factor (superfamily II helicase)
LKSLRKTVDVLTLSATPIPRTLHLSLTGIRDMSLISTPPKDRLPIITEVVPFNERIIVNALEREMARGGQVFFVHNRVRSIYAVARMIRRLVPGIRLAVAHGRMEETDLERVMLEFDDGGYDCLVATMIIESGLDIPNVNTLIVHRADQLGLAQLYQLRGRVGRSDKLAYAYLLTPAFHLLTPEAVKRLRTIEEFTELGSGFQIALRDLEIRGSGNILGVEQSGNINAVGFDLYTKLLEESILELKTAGKEFEKTTKPMGECVVDAEITAYFPNSYITDESIRVNIYQRLSSAQQTFMIDRIKEELYDRFGPIPEEAENLLDIAQLRLFGQECGVKRIILKDQSVKMIFHEEWVQGHATPREFSKHLLSVIHSSPVPIRFFENKDFGIQLSVPTKESLSISKKLLQCWR